MKLQDIVVTDAIIIDLQAEKRNDAIGEILDALVKAGAVKADLRDAFAKAIIKREERGSTGFGHGVAVPHVKHTAVDEMTVGIAISEDGVDFNALDREPVHSIFLLLSPEERPEEHLVAMEAIFGSLQQDTFRRFLRQAKSIDDVVTLLSETDANATMP